MIMKNKFIFAPAQNNGALAQLVEQWTENPCVGGSIPSLPTSIEADTDSLFFYIKAYVFYSNTR